MNAPPVLFLAFYLFHHCNLTLLLKIRELYNHDLSVFIVVNVSRL